MSIRGHGRPTGAKGDPETTTQTWRGLKLTMAPDSSAGATSPEPRRVGSCLAIFIKTSPVVSSASAWLAECGGVILRKSSSILPSRARKVRSRWFESANSSPKSKERMVEVLLSSPRLRRDPDDRKERMGATRTEVVEVLLEGALKETGGRDVTDWRRSSVGLVCCNVLGSSNSRWPWDLSFVCPSAGESTSSLASEGCG